MSDEQEKAKLWKTYGILMGVMLGGTVVVLLTQFAWGAIQQHLTQASIENRRPSDTSLTAPTSPPISTSDAQSTQPQQSTSNSLTQQEAVDVINRYLQAKEKIFAPPFDRQLAASLTTGKVYYDITKPNGSIDWLQKNNAYYQYGTRKAEPLEYFSTTENQIQIDVNIAEEVAYYQDGILRKNNNDLGEYKYVLQQEDGAWKIVDKSSKKTNN